MNTSSWKLKDVLLVAISSVLFGIIYLGCVYAGGFLFGILTPLGLGHVAYEPFYGIFFMAAPFASYVLRKPGAAVITEVMAAVLECLMGNFFGPIVILSGIVQGGAFEAIFAMKKYKNYDRQTMVMAAIVCSVVTLIYNFFVSGYNKIAAPVLILMLFVRLISAIIFDGILTPFLGDGLAKAGLLRGYALAENTNFNLEDE